jgi:O-antigen chain-terminating methyltransferase
MLESNNPDIDVARLLEKVGMELKLQQKHRTGEKHVDSEQLQVNDPYTWNQLSETLKMAELNANAGAEVTSMLHYRGIKKKIARLVGKITIFLGRVITIPQRNFNSSILHSQRIMLDGIRDMNRNTALLERQMRKIEEKSAQIDYLKTGLVTQERRVAILLEELRRQVRTGEEEAAAPVMESAAPDILDPLYLAFEDQFRGTREEIRDRLLEYIPRVGAAHAGTEERPILDLGSGRGEWLEIMKDHGLTARGVDLSHVLVQKCLERDLDVEHGDALVYLRSLPDNCLGAVTAFHLIEHIDFETRIALFDECVRVLKPGGFALFETPNPRNLLIGGCNFWADPTHLRPLYPETHQFLLEYRGLCNVELLYLHPHEDEQRLPEEEAPLLASRLNEVLSCSRDYSIVGYKA